MNGTGGGPENMTDLSKGCVAGLIKHHQALTGILEPSVGSFERLQPASMSGYWQNWGGDHRSVTTRVSSEGGKKARIEHRMADASANPYTTTAAVLQAARLGVVNGHDLPLMETGDGFEEVSSKVGVGANLGEALNHLEADTALSEAISQGLIDNHVFIKRAEIEEVAACESVEAKRDYYIHYI
jgi:glutamine synthetase